MRFNPKADIGGAVRDAAAVAAAWATLPIGGITGGGIGTIIVVIIIFVDHAVRRRWLGWRPAAAGPGRDAPTATTQCLSRRRRQRERRLRAQGRRAVARELLGRDAARADRHRSSQPTEIVTFTGGTSTGCGHASSDVGPVLLPERPDHLPRHHLLRGHARGSARRPGRRLRRAVRDRRTSTATTSRTCSAPWARSAPSRARERRGAARAAGRLLRRHVGQGRAGTTDDERRQDLRRADQATSPRRSTPPRPSATTGSRSRAGGASTPRGGPTAPPSSGCAGSRPATRPTHRGLRHLLGHQPIAPLRVVRSPR